MKATTKLRLMNWITMIFGILASIFLLIGLYFLFYMKITPTNLNIIISCLIGGGLTTFFFLTGEKITKL